MSLPLRFQHSLAQKEDESPIDHLFAISKSGCFPILCDTSPFLFRMKEASDRRLNPLSLCSIIYWITRTLQNWIKIALHLTCSSRKIGLEKQLIQQAELCTKKAVVTDEVFCCGFAGNRGLNFPKLDKSALNNLADQVRDCDEGYSSSVTRLYVIVTLSVDQISGMARCWL